LFVTLVLLVLVVVAWLRERGRALRYEWQIKRLQLELIHAQEIAEKSRLLLITRKPGYRCCMCSRQIRIGSGWHAICGATTHVFYLFTCYDCSASFLRVLKERTSQ
jgi:hypothetical protein